MLTQKQKEERKLGIGGSDIAVLMGISTYKTPYQLYLEKRGESTDESKESQVQYWGSTLEQIIRQEFEKRNNLKVHCPNDTQIHPLFQFIRGNVDGMLEDGSVFEAKTCSAFMANKWDDGIPLNYKLQVALYCAITSAKKAHVAVLIGGNDYREFIYDRDFQLESQIIKASCDFWDCVQDGVPPPPVDLSDLKLLYPESKPKSTKPSNEEVDTSIQSLREVRENMAKLKKEEEEIKYKLVEYIKENEEITDCFGDTVCTYKSTKKGIRILKIKD